MYNNMKKLLAVLILSIGCLSLLQAQTPKEKDQVIQMNKQMFLDKVFDYTTGATEWSYKGNKPAVIDFYATWCGPCRMVAPILKDLAKEYGDSIVIYKVDTDKEKELSGVWESNHSPLLYSSRNRASHKSLSELLTKQPSVER